MSAPASGFNVTLELIAAGVMALGLLGYLVYALLYPERF